MSEQSTQLADSLRKKFAGPMTEEEQAFLRDVQGFIEFAMRNGLSFSVVVANIGHDVNEISRCGFDLTAAKRAAFQPKVAGFARISTQEVGQSEEQD